MLLSFLWLLLFQAVMPPAPEPVMASEDMVVIAPDQIINPDVETPDPEPAPEPEPEPPVTPVTPAPTPTPTPTPTPEATPAPRDCKWWNPPPNGMYTYDEWCDRRIWLEAHNYPSNPDYIRMYSGVCPSQQDAPRDIVDAMGHAAALTLLADFPSKEHFVEQLWVQGKRNALSSSSGRMGYTSGNNLHISGDMAYNWSTLIITWDGPSDPAREAEAQAMTQYLRSLDARYNIACPND